MSDETWSDIELETWVNETHGKSTGDSHATCWNWSGSSYNYDLVLQRKGPYRIRGWTGAAIGLTETRSGRAKPISATEAARRLGATKNQ